jgi:hypothetical protein
MQAITAHLMSEREERIIMTETPSEKPEPSEAAS